MLNNLIGRLVDYCTRFAWAVIALGAVVTVLSSAYVARHFAINTDITKLISPKLDWRQREAALSAAFPQDLERILAVVEGPTPEMASAATSALVQRLSADPALFRTVQQLGGGPFFDRNGLLFLPTEEVARTVGKLGQAGPILGTLAADPSLRGLSQALSLSLIGIQRKQVSLDDMAPVFNMAADSFDAVLAGKPATFSWEVLLKGKPAETSDLRRFVDLWPVLDFSALEPGHKPTEAIRNAVNDLKLAADYGASVKLTGPVPIADQEFATLQEGAVENALITIAVVLLILWLALRSARIILAVFLNLIVGLAMTAALGLMLVPALNPISVAFAVLFVGLGVDFGIQYSVRYRAERHAHSRHDLHHALVLAGRRVGAPLTLAAAATAAGFFSFLPTVYLGLSELGLIAGSGMLIAFVTSVTLLPALITVLKPGGEPEPMGFKILAPADTFLARHRIAVVAATGLVVLAGLPLLLYLRFDFNPLHLRSPKTESIATYLELKNDSKVATNTIQILAPSLDRAREIALRLAKLPEVAHTMTLESFIPDHQDEKLALIQKAAQALDAPLHPAAQKPAPSDAERVTALNAAAANLTRVAGQSKGLGADAAKRLADDLTKLANADAPKRLAAEETMTRPLKIDLDHLRESLQAQPISLETLPQGLINSWVAKDGRARVEVTPAGDRNENATLRQFARAVLAAEPNATGEAIGIYEAGKTIVRAFIEAGAWALFSIAILLWIVLRRLGDVLLTLVPLILAGILTLELTVVIGQPLNFANIIALPLLLGVGVAFKIYYVMAWRAGQTNLLQSSLTRAVIFSALTTATAFGSLWFSSHPGTSSMGELLALALLTTMVAAVFFQPALMGPPRKDAVK
jgi:hopanoid biosynthesis associated RND transporter like protein HpnN